MRWFILVLLITSCAQVTSLNMRKHEFGILPSKIIWFQVAGLSEEHVAMLRFMHSEERKTAFEESTCIGKMWIYNLYRLRPLAHESFLSQMSGKKNVKNSCEDSQLKPIWSYLSTAGYSTGIYERGALANQSLISLNQCENQEQKFLEDVYFWSGQAPVNSTDVYHYRETIPLMSKKVYFDRSCTGTSCTSSINDNLQAIYSAFSESSNKNLMIIRDFSYLEALNKKDYFKAREILFDLERSYAYALGLSRSNGDFLVLLTSGDPRGVQFPEQGKEWYELEKTGAHLSFNKTQLTNLVLASGARAENFCGVFDDASIFERILSGPKQQGLELKLINPFK